MALSLLLVFLSVSLVLGDASEMVVRRQPHSNVEPGFHIGPLQSDYECEACLAFFNEGKIVLNASSSHSSFEPTVGYPGCSGWRCCWLL